MPCLPKHEPGFCQWLLDVLDQNRSPKNAYWIDRKQKVFAVRWTHGRSAAWNPECGELFKLWKIECSRNRGKQSVTFVHKDMKTNFRMNLKSERFLELREKRVTKGVGAVRVYKIVKMPTKLPKTALQIAEIIERKPQNRTLSRKTAERAVFPRKSFRGTCLEKHSRETSMPFVNTAADQLFLQSETSIPPSNVQFAQQPLTTPDAVFSSNFTTTPDIFQFPSPKSSITEPDHQLFDKEGLNQWSTPDVRERRNSIQRTSFSRMQDDATWCPNNIETSVAQVCTNGDIFSGFNFQWYTSGCLTRERISDDDSTYFSDDGYFISEADSISDGQTVLDLLKDGNMNGELPCGSNSVSNFSYGETNYRATTFRPDDKGLDCTRNVSSFDGINEENMNKDCSELGLTWDFDDCLQ